MGETRQVPPLAKRTLIHVLLPSVGAWRAPGVHQCRHRLSEAWVSPLGADDPRLRVQQASVPYRLDILQQLGRGAFLPAPGSWGNFDPGQLSYYVPRVQLSHDVTPVVPVHHIWGESGRPVAGTWTRGLGAPHTGPELSSDGVTGPSLAPGNVRRGAPPAAHQGHLPVDGSWQGVLARCRRWQQPKRRHRQSPWWPGIRRYAGADTPGAY